MYASSPFVSRGSPLTYVRPPMAATASQVTLRFAGGVSHAAGGSEDENGETKKVGSLCWSRRAKREMTRSLCVRSTYQSVDRINGNGRRVNGVDGPPLPPPLRTSSIGLVNGSEPMHAYKLGRFVEDRFVYRQIFVIRSYEIGPDKTATMETLMNLLQETALNHVMSSGLAGDGFGATLEMSIRKLIWVVTRINIQVHQYSSWGDVIEIDTWVAPSGKNGMRRDWIIRDCKTQKIITRATSTWVIMNRETRKLSKMPEQVRTEVEPFYFNRSVINISSNNSKIDKLDDETAESVRSGLAPRWSDMDANQHVNNVKYIGWILESVPTEVLEHYNLTSMTLEYRRECRQSHLLESLTSMKAADTQASLMSGSSSRTYMNSTHLLRMKEDKAEIVRAQAQWRLKGKHKTHTAEFISCK